MFATLRTTFALHTLKATSSTGLAAQKPVGDAVLHYTNKAKIILSVDSLTVILHFSVHHSRTLGEPCTAYELMLSSDAARARQSTLLLRQPIQPKRYSVVHAVERCTHTFPGCLTNSSSPSSGNCRTTFDVSPCNVALYNEMDGSTIILPSSTPCYESDSIYA
jgi:hypothetical protein